MTSKLAFLQQPIKNLTIFIRLNIFAFAVRTISNHEMTNFDDIYLPTSFLFQFIFDRKKSLVIVCPISCQNSVSGDILFEKP